MGFILTILLLSAFVAPFLIGESVAVAGAIGWAIAFFNFSSTRAPESTTDPQLTERSFSGFHAWAMSAAGALGSREMYRFFRSDSSTVRKMAVLGNCWRAYLHRNWLFFGFALLAAAIPLAVFNWYVLNAPEQLSEIPRGSEVFIGGGYGAFLGAATGISYRGARGDSGIDAPRLYRDVLREDGFVMFVVARFVDAAKWAFWRIRGRR